MECLILKTLLFSETNNKQILFFVKHSSLRNISRRLHRLIIWMEYIKLNIQIFSICYGGQVVNMPSWGHFAPGSNPDVTYSFFYIFFSHISFFFFPPPEKNKLFFVFIHILFVFFFSFFLSFFLFLVWFFPLFSVFPLYSRWEHTSDRMLWTCVVDIVIDMCCPWHNWHSQPHHQTSHGIKAGGYQLMTSI